MPVAVAAPAAPAAPAAASPSKSAKAEATFGATLAVHVGKRGDTLHDDGAHPASVDTAGTSGENSTETVSGIPSDLPVLDVPASEASAPDGTVQSEGTAQPDETVRSGETLQPDQPAITLPIPDARHHLPGLPGAPAAPSDVLGGAPTVDHAEVQTGGVDRLITAVKVVGGAPVLVEGQQPEQQVPSPSANATGSAVVQDQKPEAQGVLQADAGPSTTGESVAPAQKPAAPAAGPATIPVPDAELASPAPVDGQSEPSALRNADVPDVPVASTTPSSQPLNTAPASPSEAVQPAETQILPATNVPRVQPDAAAAVFASEASRPSPAPPSSYPSLAGQILKPAFSLTGSAPGEYAITVQVAPENLGPVTVKALVTQDGLRVELFAPNEAGREALKAVLPELRREFSSSTMQATVDVSSEKAETGSNSGTTDRGRERRDFELLRRLPTGPVAEEPLPDRMVRTWHSTSTIDLLA